jgi:hypothetical protein
MSVDSKRFSGGCLCGAVRYEVEAEPQMMGDCYCLDCRKSSGTAHCSQIGVPAAATKITGTTSHFDKPADSGNVVTRHFCPTCGSALYSTNSGMTGLLFLRASSLDDPEVYRPMMTVCTSRAPSWAHIEVTAPASACGLASCIEA